MVMKHLGLPSMEPSETQETRPVIVTFENADTRPIFDSGVSPKISVRIRGADQNRYAARVLQPFFPCYAFLAPHKSFQPSLLLTFTSACYLGHHRGKAPESKEHIMSENSKVTITGRVSDASIQGKTMSLEPEYIDACDACGKESIDVCPISETEALCGECHFDYCSP
jgi:hypothetical protein